MEHMLASGVGVEPDLIRASALFERAAAAGDAFAAFNLASMLRRAAGDGDRVVELLRQASAGGVAEASLMLATRAADRGFEAEARGLYELAATQGSAEAMPLLAVRYRDGIGGAVSRVEALRWFLKMLDHGNGDGVHEAMSLARMMHPTDILRAAELAGRSADAPMRTGTRPPCPRWTCSQPVGQAGT
ncbi:hypothetical protein AB0873_28900 [Micromonospora sp. NPDC047707]|uniref:tetratricopeptide repeat protein n=1 Tax=Micromonospora sp. NPDC047707 TaxID=3154498 RepID=UPI003455D867